MSHEVETLMYVRERPWHGLGTMVEEAPCSSDALKLAGLDWNVRSEDVLSVRGDVIPGYKANLRDSDETVLGIVGSKYKIVQNAEAFAFTDSIIGGDVRYECPGSLRQGRTVFLLARMPETKLAGDDVEPYMCFTNSHDGTGAVRVCMTPIRVVCNNTLNLALHTAKRMWSMRHTENIGQRLDEARDCLLRAENYMDGLAEYAEAASKKQISDTELQAFLSDLFPVTDKTTEQQKVNIARCKQEYMVCYFAPDIAKFQGTAWGAINAMSDFVGHNMPHRNTRSYAENNWGRIMDGHILMDRMTALCMK